jgi:hypothetical protein
MTASLQVVPVLEMSTLLPARRCTLQGATSIISIISILEVTGSGSEHQHHGQNGAMR